MKKRASKLLILAVALLIVTMACTLTMCAEDYQTGDMDGNGVINSNDAIYLLRHTLNPEKYPLACNHNLTVSEFKPATCSEEGSIEYWYCSLCSKYFADENATLAISYADTIIGVDATAHEYSAEWSIDETHHWHNAVCAHTTVKKDYAAHNWDGGVANGNVKLYTCADCGKTKTETVTYTVTFCDYDGSVLKTETVEAGKSASAPAAPSRDGYVFAGWDKSFDNITGDLTVTATYTKTSSAPTITVGNVTGAAGDEVTVKLDMTGSPKLYAMSLKIAYDDTALTLVSTTSGEAMDAFTYMAPSRLKNGANFVWYANDPANADGTVLELTFKINDNAVPGSYTVSMTNDPSNTYDENENDVNITFVNGSVKVEASATVATYTVTFCDYDGKVLKTETVEEGKSASAPATPARDGYVFAGWDKSFNNITGDLTVTATYTKVTSPTIVIGNVMGAAGDEVTVKLDMSGSPKLYAMSLKIAYDDTALTLVSTASGAAMDAFTYTRPSRLKSGANFMWYANDPASANGTVLELKFKINDGTAAGSYPITMTCDPSNTYDENENDVNITFVNGSVKVEASATVATYTVTFCDYDGSVLKTETVEAGKSATAPADPKRDGYAFAGWDKSFSNVTGNITVTATYTKITDPTVTIGNAIGVAGEQVTVTVDLANSPELYAASLQLTYDDAALTLVSAASGDAMSAFTYTAPSRLKNGANFMWYANDPASANGRILTLTFKINDGAAAGNYTVLMICDPSSTYDANDNDVDLAIVSGGVTVTK